MAYSFAMVKLQMEYSKKKKEGYASLGEFTDSNGNIDDSSSAFAVLPSYSI